MEFVIDRADLIAAVDKCVLAVPDAKHPTEVFRVMTVDATKKKTTVRFAAVGELCSVDTVAKVDLKSAGSFNVYPKHLRDVASSMPPGRIQFSMKGSRITVKSLVSSRKASFEHHGVDIKPVDDPGKTAAWVHVDSQELVRGLKMVKSACTWHDRNDPVVSLLIPTERGLDIFGCNGYLVSLVETSLTMTGAPVLMPATAVAVLLLMAPDDARLKLFSDGRRVYLENADTLVSAQLPAEYSPATYPMIIGFLKDPTNIAGPTFALAPLQAGVRAVLSLAGFAGDSDKKGQRGYRLKVGFSASVTVELGFSAADAKDEFEVEKEGDAGLEFALSSLFFDQMLSSLVGVEQVQALRANNMLVLRAEGVVAGIMEERPE